MNRSLSLFAIGLIFGGGIGFTLAAASGAAFEGHDHGDSMQHGAGADQAMADHGAHAAMHDTPLDVSAENAPELSVMVTPDPVSGYNLHVLTRNFTFAPARASQVHVPGEGHAHVYVNGEKQGRLYGKWYHLASLPRGDVEVAVSLNSNDHSPLAVDGAPIRAVRTVTVE